MADLFLKTSLAMIISFILPSYGTLVTLELPVTLLAALIGLLDRGPLLASLILSNISLFY
jgi:hypothetical protein